MLVYARLMAVSRPESMVTGETMVPNRARHAGACTGRHVGERDAASWRGGEIGMVDYTDKTTIHVLYPPSRPRRMVHGAKQRNAAFASWQTERRWRAASGEHLQCPAVASRREERSGEVIVRPSGTAFVVVSRTHPASVDRRSERG